MKRHLLIKVTAGSTQMYEKKSTKIHLNLFFQMPKHSSTFLAVSRLVNVSATFQLLKTEILKLNVWQI